MILIVGDRQLGEVYSRRGFGTSLIADGVYGRIETLSTEE
jgi:hypothetical protein